MTTRPDDVTDAAAATDGDTTLARARATWSDPAQPADARVEALLGVMTTTEKVAQLGSTWHRDPDMFDRDGDGPERGGVAPMADAFGDVQSWEVVRAVGIGHLTRPFGTRPVDPGAGLADLAARQRDLVAHSRLGIPAIAHEECLTGFTTLGATVHPTPLALAATFDPSHARAIARGIADDLRAVDVHQALAPVLDVVGDPRWGRTEETFGAAPYLVATMATAYVSGLERRGIVATLKHFAGHAASRAGRNHAPVSMGRRELADVHLPPFEMALRLGGARSVMNSYADIDGVPPATDPWLLTDLLRDQWGFDGTVVSDYGSIGFLVDMHRVAGDRLEAASLALSAGIDVELPESHGYDGALVDLVERGSIDPGLVDRSVRRVLRQKVELGLLDADWAPRSHTDVDLDAPATRALARDAARASLVLLANDGTLPVGQPPARVAVVGPGADEPSAFLGCYSYPNHVLPRYPDLGLGIEVDSVLDALRAQWPEVVVDHARGCPVTDETATEPAGDGDLARAVEVVAEADLAVLVMADQPGMFGRGTSGEGNDATDLALPGRQAELADRVLATGTPVVVVVASGRPYALGGIADRAAAVVQAFLPGAEGGHAIAELLAGAIEPVGRLPIQVPQDPGGQPASHRHPVLGEAGLGISSADVVPAFPFGHGLSWTTFELTDLAVSPDTITTAGTVEVACTVTNTGDRPGTEVVQLYLDDPVAEVARPVRDLLGYARVGLDRGARATVRFTVHADRLAYTGRDGTRIVDAGEVRLHLGRSVGDLPLVATVTVTGQTRRVGHDRVLDTPTVVRPTTTTPTPIPTPDVG